MALLAKSKPALPSKMSARSSKKVCSMPSAMESEASLSGPPQPKPHDVVKPGGAHGQEVVLRDGAAIGHISPEAWAGGAIGLLLGGITWLGITSGPDAFAFEELDRLAPVDAVEPRRGLAPARGNPAASEQLFQRRTGFPRSFGLNLGCADFDAQRF